MGTEYGGLQGSFLEYERCFDYANFVSGVVTKVAKRHSQSARTPLETYISRRVQRANLRPWFFSTQRVFIIEHFRYLKRTYTTYKAIFGVGFSLA